MPDLGDTSTRLHAPGGSRISRRRVIGTAAWSAPAIVIATGAPAFAASTTPVLTATWVTDSFRATNDAELVAGTPVYNGGAQRAAMAVAVTVTEADVSSLTCQFSTAGNGVTWKNVGAITRNSTSWAANNGDVSGQGFAATPLPSVTTAFTAATFTHGPVTAGTTLYIRMVVDQIGASDFPFNFVFSAPGATSKTIRATGSTTASPYITGASV